MRHEKMLTGRIKSLLKLQEQRIKQMEMQYLEKRKICDEAREALEQRLASIASLKTKRSDVFRYLEQRDVLGQSVCHERAHQYRYWLEYDLEKDEYYLEMDREALTEAETALEETRKAWLHAQAKKSGMEKMLNTQQQKIRQSMEYRIELEIEETFLSGLRVV